MFEPPRYQATFIPRGPVAVGHPAILSDAPATDPTLSTGLLEQGLEHRLRSYLATRCQFLIGYRAFVAFVNHQ